MPTQKTAMVFGGSRGIGAAVVERLAADGFAVAFTYVSRPDAADDLVQAVAARGGTAWAIRADSGEPEQITQAVRSVVERSGPLAAVVVNAGILRAGLVEDVPLEDLDLMLRVNVRGVYLAVQAVVPHLAEGGAVVTIGSNVANRGSAGSSVYQLTKAAVAGMVKGIALDLAPRGLRINNLQPGPFDTDMNAGAVEALAGRSPMGRVGSGPEAGALVSYLVGDESEYVTGADFTIDGGWSV